MDTEGLLQEVSQSFPSNWIEEKTTYSTLNKQQQQTGGHPDTETPLHLTPVCNHAGRVGTVAAPRLSVHSQQSAGPPATAVAKKHTIVLRHV